MASVVVNWTTKQQSFPTGTTGGDSHVQIFAADGTTVVTTPKVATGASATFDNIAPGNYVAKIRRYNGAGSAVLGEASAAFTVAAPAPASVEVPDVVTVAVL